MTGGGASRAQREAAFHDERFENDSSRAGAKKYYSVTRSSTERLEAALDRLGPGDRVLEVGCGVQSRAVALAGRGIRVVAVDISPVAVEQMTASVVDAGYADLVDVRVMDAERLEFDADSFEMAIGTGILHHLDLEDALAGLSRVLSPDGRAVFVEPMGTNPLINLYRRVTPRMRTADEHPLVPDDIRSAQRWFEDVDVTYFHASSIIAVPFRRTRAFDPVLRRADALDRWVFDVLPVTRRLAWSCVLELARPRAVARQG